MQGRNADPGTLLVRRSPGAKGTFFYEAKWRTEDGKQIKRRLGKAWLSEGPDGEIAPRRGRIPADSDYLDERRAYVKMHEMIVGHGDARDATKRAAEDRVRATRTFRHLAHQWLDYSERVKNIKPSTLRDYRCVLAEPGIDPKTGKARRGRIMKALGDIPAHQVTTVQVEKLLTSVSDEGLAPRSVNKQRETLLTIFNYGASPISGYALTHNPVIGTSVRTPPPPARLEVFDVEQIEALARSAAAGDWRTDRDNEFSLATLEARKEEDQQLAELLRVASYTGLRRGELVTLRWRDVNWQERVLIVERTLSDKVETVTKSRRTRYVPLADQPLAALDRQSRRPNFTGPDDYVFCNAAGDRLDTSALRRRYIGARDAAGLPPLRFHDLRHTAGSLLIREIDPASVKDILGHADLKTTERYLHAQRASVLVQRATKAFSPAAPSPAPAETEDERGTILEQVGALLAQLPSTDREALLAQQRAAA